MSQAEIERELHESNGVNKNMLVLPPRIPIERSTLDNVDHRPILIAFRDETYSTYYKTYGVLFRGDHCFARDYIETRRITDASTATNSHTRRVAAAANQGAYTTLHYTTLALNTFRQNIISTNARNAGRTRSARTITQSASHATETTHRTTQAARCG